jgi:hypothetical protein
VTQTNLFYAILALDSYNRGPNPSVGVLGGAGSAVGSVTILNVPVPLGAEAASFYAAAYQDSSGNIVISDRGTDAPLGSDFTAWTGGARQGPDHDQRHHPCR